MDKIQNTFNRTMDQIEKYSKVYRDGGKLEQAVAQDGGDIAWFKDIRDALEDLMHALEEAQMSHGVATTNEAVTESKQINEGVLDGDDDDGFMARSQLYFMARDAIQLHGMIDDRDNLPGWVQSKISQSAEAIDAVRRYTEYNAMQTPAPQEAPAEMPMEDASKPSFPVKVTLAGDSIWDRRGENPEFVTVTDYTISEPEYDEGETYRHVSVKHDGPWSIYTDTGFEKTISDMIGFEVSFTEQGMQEDGIASMEGYVDSVDEGFKDMAVGAAMLGALGSGVAGLNAMNDPSDNHIYQAMTYAAQQGDERAEEIADNFMLYADEAPSSISGWANANKELVAKFKSKMNEELEEAKVRGMEVFDKTFANRAQADNFAKKNGGRVKQVGRVFYVFKEEVEESVQLSEASDDDWVVVKGRKVVRTLKNPKNNKAPRNWQKSSDETEVIRVKKAKQMGILEEVEINEGMEFDGKKENNVDSLKVMASDMFKDAKARAQKKIK